MKLCKSMSVQIYRLIVTWPVTRSTSITYCNKKLKYPVSALNCQTGVAGHFDRVTCATSQGIRFLWIPEQYVSEENSCNEILLKLYIFPLCCRLKGKRIMNKCYILNKSGSFEERCCSIAMGIIFLLRNKRIICIPLCHFTVAALIVK